MLTQGRFQKYKICTEVVGVISCRDGQFPVEWNVSHTHCPIFLVDST